MHFPLGIKANSWPSAELFGSLVPTYDLCTSINPPVQQKTEYRARKQDDNKVPAICAAKR